MLGDTAAAFATLASAPEWVESAYLPAKVPVSLLQAQAWEMAGDRPRARASYEAARAAVQSNLKNPGMPIFFSVLGLVEAGSATRTPRWPRGGVRWSGPRSIANRATAPPGCSRWL